MKKIICLAALALTACKTTEVVNCGNAARVRAAAVLAIQAVDRACPANFTSR